MGWHMNCYQSKAAEVPINMLDLIRKCFGYSQFWSSQHAARIRPDHACWILLPTSDSSEEGLDHIVWNWPGSNLDGLVRFWPNTSGLEASQCARIIGPSSGRMQMAHYHFQTQLPSSTDGPDYIVQNQPRSDLVLADSVGFEPKRSGPEASRCVRIIGLASGQHFWADLDQMWTGSDMFPGVMSAGQIYICVNSLNFTNAFFSPYGVSVQLHTLGDPSVFSWWVLQQFQLQFQAKCTCLWAYTCSHTSSVFVVCFCWKLIFCNLLVLKIDSGKMNWLFLP